MTGMIALLIVATSCSCGRKENRASPSPAPASTPLPGAIMDPMAQIERKENPAAASSLAVTNPASDEPRWESYERRARESILEGESAFKIKRFSKATRVFKDAVDALKEAGVRPENELERKRAEKGLLESTYMEAFVLMEVKEYEEAKKRCRAALLLGHPFAGELTKEIELRERLAATQRPTPPGR